MPPPQSGIGVAALLVALLIDRRGRVAATHVGVVEKAAFEREQRLLLAETGGH